MIGLKWLPEAEISRTVFVTWVYSKIFDSSVYSSPFHRKKKEPKSEPKPPPRPTVTMADRASAFQGILDAEPGMTRAALARRMGVPRAWVMRVLSSRQ